MIAENQIEAVVLRIIQHGRDRCGAGFGKYPLGVLAAVEELVKAGASTPDILAKLYDFRERLER